MSNSAPHIKLKSKLPKIGGKPLTPTKFFELFQSLGLSGRIKDFESLKAVSKSQYAADLHLIEDWSVFEENIELQEQALRLAINTQSFVSGKPQAIINKSIDKFYELMAAYEGIEVIKTNTADSVLILNASIDELFKALRSDMKMSYDKNGLITIGSINFYQISLKKSTDGARLGRLTTYFKDKYGQNELLNEGILDRIKSLGTIIMQLFNKTKNKLSSCRGPLYNPFTKSITNLNKMLKRDKLVQDTLKLLDKLEVSESKNTEGRLLENVHQIQKDIDDTIERLRMFDKSNVVTVKALTGVKKVNKDQMALYNTLKKRYTGASLDRRSQAELIEIRSSIHLLLANKITLEYMEAALLKINGSAEQASKDIAEMMTLTLKGSTQYPVVIVYGNGTFKVIDKVKQTKTEAIPSIIIDVHPSANNLYYVTYMYMLTELASDIDKSIYAKIQFTTSAGYRSVAFKVEGNAFTTYEKVLKALK